MRWSRNASSGHRCCLGSLFSFPIIQPHLRPGQPVSYVLMILNCSAEVLQGRICLSKEGMRRGAQAQGGLQVTPEATACYST